MSDKEDQGDVGDLTENAEYEDDFEKDPESLTDEEQRRGEKENPGEKDAEAQKDADRSWEDNEEVEENLDQIAEEDVNVKVIYSNEKYMDSKADTKQKDHESERESSVQESKLENEQDKEEDEEMKCSVMGKIEEANKDLENQNPTDQNGERKLKFRDEMGHQAPAPEDAEAGKTDLARRDDISAGLSQLQISDDKEQNPTSLSEHAAPDEETTDGKILVEKDRKFELLSLCDIESQGILPSISVSFTDTEAQQTSPKSSSLPADSPSDSKDHPDSALDGAKDQGKQKTESASKSVKSSTYTLTPRQKELRMQIELRKERLKREEEERKKELEELKRRENELVYRAWLLKKKEQMKEEKRNRRAKQLEELRMKEVNRDPEEAYRLWLKKKHQQYVKEKRIEYLRRQTEEVSFFPSAEECDRAFKDWLRRKREEKRAAELDAKERTRQIRFEARRARKMRNIQYI
ncbi:coiled-coil domain-containing protein 181 [Chamaea fasciata]|uniref:coiled-coil domain-containing protein 181 n=1 Tax=Chamaea fasciata TaxID=190680 RepID=UPI003369CEAA